MPRGVGRAVTDLLRERGIDRVPKRDPVSGLEVSLQTGALKVAEGLQLWPALRQEMQTFRRKINLATAHDSYEHWRETTTTSCSPCASLAGAR